MKVDFTVKNAPSYKVAYILRYGPYAGQDTWRSELTQIERWAKRNRIRTGKWIVYFIDKWTAKSQKKRRSIAAIEIKGKGKPQAKIRLMKIPRQKVVSVTFDPNNISADLVYLGIEGWLEESRTYTQTTRSREVYNGNPWTNPNAWANCEVQVPIRRK
ncbi:MAG TPA: GyrI-like domain-containing protein [Candidatus Acidoferrales bacterium]|nr:GyrI-like domain-containing protein [Candidatus Acidoferrales bacterium]